jgi:hypothetical protein
MDGEDFHIFQTLRCAHALLAMIKRRSLRQFHDEFGFPKIGGNDFEAI